MSDESKDNDDAWVYVAVPLEENSKKKKNKLLDDEDDIMRTSKEKESSTMIIHDNNKMMMMILVVGLLLGSIVFAGLAVVASTTTEESSSYNSHPSKSEPTLVDKISLQKKTNHQGMMHLKHLAVTMEKHMEEEEEDNDSKEAVESRRALKDDNEEKLLEYSDGVAMMLTPATIDAFLTQHEMTFVYFYVNNQCPSCHKLLPVMNDFAHQAIEEDVSVGVGLVDCNEHGLLCASLDLHTFPTLRFYFQDSPSLEHKNVVHLAPRLRITHEERVKSLVQLAKRMIARNNIESMQDEEVAEKRDLRIVA